MKKAVLLSMFAWSLISCGKKSEPEPEPDPLRSATGTYMGSVEENGKLIGNIKANLITEQDTYGKLYISSIGLTGSNYQLILKNGSGTVNGYTYRCTPTVNGNILNISGKFSQRLDHSSYPQYNFSFTGTRQ